MQQIKDLGGRTLLSHYKYSLFRCLKSVYSGMFVMAIYLRSLEIEWKKEWFPNLPIVAHSHWNSISNRRKFLDELKQKFDIKSPQDWGRITTQCVRDTGGIAILNAYKGSLFRCLQSVYQG